MLCVTHSILFWFTIVYLVIVTTFYSSSNSSIRKLTKCSCIETNIYIAIFLMFPVIFSIVIILLQVIHVLHLYFFITSIVITTTLRLNTINVLKTSFTIIDLLIIVIVIL